MAGDMDCTNGCAVTNGNTSNTHISSNNNIQNNTNVQRPCNKEVKGRPLKITAVGDGMVGKTCMLITYTTQEFPTEYIPTVFDNFADTISVDGLEYNATLWDTAGQEDYERLRPLSYPNTDCFLLCYSVSSRSSYDNIISKWHPELKHHCPHVPIILVATKSDLRGTTLEAVTINEGKKMKRKIHASRHMECSALNNEGLNEIFMESIRCAIRKPRCIRRECFSISISNMFLPLEWRCYRTQEFKLQVIDSNDNQCLVLRKSHMPKEVFTSNEETSKVVDIIE